MEYKVSLRISDDFYHELKEEAAKSQSTLSSMLRRKMIAMEQYHKTQKNRNVAQPSFKEQVSSQPHILHQENNLLLRKIARHLNSQIVRQVDEKLSLNKESNRSHY